MKYEIGDKVIIANEDKIYQYWEDWFDEYKVNKKIKAHFNSGKWPDVSHTFNVVAVGYDQRYTDYEVYAIRDKNGDVYLIAESGIAKAWRKKMKKKKFSSRIEYIALYFGKNRQTQKAIEELGELITALARGTDIDNIEEEIADVFIMINQLKVLYDIYPETVVKEKLNRTELLIEQMEEQKKWK